MWDHFGLRTAASPEPERLSNEINETAALCRPGGDAAACPGERSGIGHNGRVKSGIRTPEMDKSGAARYRRASGFRYGLEAGCGKTRSASGRAPHRGGAFRELPVGEFN